MCVTDAELVGCETVINPLEMFSHMTDAADTDNDEDDIKFIFTIRLTLITVLSNCFFAHCTCVLY